MNRITKIVAIMIVISNICSLFLSPIQLRAQDNVLSLKAKFPKQRVEGIVEDIKDGKKVSIDESIYASGDEVIPNQFTVFFKKSSKDRIANALGNVEKYSVEGEYVDAVAVPITIDQDQNVEDILNELDSNGDVLAVTQVVERSTSAVSINDPFFPPTGNFSSSYQWYLNRPASGNYGIDVLRAWEYMDDHDIEWRGDDSIIVAVLDTGLAYENISKYVYDGDESWDFTAPTEKPANMYTNSGEVASNDLDDDGNGGIEDTLSSPFNTLYCLDANSNGQCDSPSERTKGYVDDVNGFNVVDFYNYWRPLNVTSASNCSNAPYTTYKCVPQRVCQTSGDAGSNHFGCDITEMGHPNDLMGHGTAVTGIIAGAINNSTAGSGISPNVSVLPINVFRFVYNLSSGTWGTSGSSEHIARAVDYAVDSGAKIINMSFGGSLPDPYEQLAMERAYEEGSLLVAASGNTGGSSVQYPAGYSGVMAVGASSKNGTKVSYSNYGSGLELVAPVSGGVPIQSYTCYFSQNCLTTNPRPNSTSQFTQFSTGLTAGTSFAAPQVSAVAALLWTTYPTWTNEQIRYVLKMSASQITTEYSTSTGYGVLNAYNAVRARDDLGRDLTQKGRVYQSVRGGNNMLFDRYSDDFGSVWGDWLQHSVTVADQPTIIYNPSSGRLVQALRDTSNRIRVRTSSNKGLNWGSWVNLGSTKSNIALVSADDKVILSMRGLDNGIYTKVSSNGGQTWGGWNKSGSTPNKISMIYDSGSGRVTQVVRGMDGGIYTRYSDNKGVSWSNWVRSGSTPGNITLIQASNRIIMFVRGGNNAIFMRYSTNGGKNWGGWTSNSTTYGDVAAVYTGSRIVISAMGSNNSVLLRYSTNLGSSWSSWVSGGKSNHVGTLAFSPQYNRVIISVVGQDNGIWTRYSDNGASSWTNWVRRGSSPSPSYIEIFETENW